ncbi:MAG: ABC transporter permease [Pseudomonadota bacterium]|nr:ABC transporter permease [Pseudomonadota bacterium]
MLETPHRELNWTPFYALVLREIRRFLKVATQTVVMPVVNSSLYLLIFGVSLGQRLSVQTEISYLAFLIPGLVMMAALNNALMNSSSSIIIAKFSGELEDLRVAPLSPENILWAMAIGGLFRGYVVGGITFLVGLAFYRFYDEQWLVISHPFVLVYFLSAGCLAFGKIGIAVALWAKNFDHVSAVTAFIVMPLLYLGGVFYSIESLSPFWRSVSQYNPLLYMINGVRYGVLGVSDVSVVTAALVTLGALVLSHFLARFSLRTGSYQRW